MRELAVQLLPMADCAAAAEGSCREAGGARRCVGLVRAAAALAVVAAVGLVVVVVVAAGEPGEPVALSCSVR